MEEIDMLRQEAAEYGRRKILEALVNVEKELIRHAEAMDALGKEQQRLRDMPPGRVLEMYIREYR